MQVTRSPTEINCNLISPPPKKMVGWGSVKVTPPTQKYWLQENLRKLLRKTLTSTVLLSTHLEPQFWGVSLFF